MKVDLIVLIIACVLAAVVAGVVCWFMAIAYRKKIVEAKIGSAESMARDIKNDALKAAEAMKKEAMLEIKEEKLKTQNELEKEAKSSAPIYIAMSSVSCQRKKPLIRRLPHWKRRKTS